MLLVYAERPSPRTAYVVRHVFERMLGWRTAITFSLEEFSNASGPKTQYQLATTIMLARKVQGAPKVNSQPKSAKLWIDLIKRVLQDHIRKRRMDNTKFREMKDRKHRVDRNRPEDFALGEVTFLWRLVGFAINLFMVG